MYCKCGDPTFCEFSECERTQIRTARKQHRCGECREPILPGERYEYRSGIDQEREPYSVKTCLVCARIRTDFLCCWTYGELRQAIWDCLGLDYITGATVEPDEREDD